MIFDFPDDVMHAWSDLVAGAPAEIGLLVRVVQLGVMDRAQLDGGALEVGGLKLPDRVGMGRG